MTKVKAKKSRLEFYISELVFHFFFQDTYKENLKNHNKPICGLENQNKYEIKVNMSSSFFSQTLRIRKTFNVNFSHQNEQIDTDIINFGGLNRFQ